MTLDFELDKLDKELQTRKPKKVIVQLPEGIKQNAFEIVQRIKKHNIEVLVSGETAWGGCCVSLEEAKNFEVDLIIHFGHAKFIDTSFPVLYIEVKDNIDLNPLLKRSLPQLENYKTLSLSYSIQHKHDIDNIIKFYENNGKKIVLSEKIGFAAYSGHVVGCEFRGLKSIQDKVDAFLVIGNNFHSMGAAISVEKPVFLIDVYNDKVSEMKGVRDMILKQRAVSIDKLRYAKKVGVIVEIKPGQKFGSPTHLMKLLEKNDKEAILISMNEMTEDKIMNFYNIDCFIELACPRIAVDDFKKYSKPIVTYKEALVALGEKTWEELIEQGLL